MNKKRYIVPSIVLSVSVILLVATLIFTTNFVFCTGLNTFNGERIEKSMPFSEMAYKINPCYSNLRALYDSYNYLRYYSPYEENSTADMDKVPEDYYKNALNIQKRCMNIMKLIQRHTRVIKTQIQVLMLPIQHKEWR